MDYKVYWVGEKPGGAMTITVLDEESGLPADLSIYNAVRLVMLDSKNNEVDLDGGVVAISNPAQGRVVFGWPSDRSLFERPGEYVFQLEFTTPSAVVKTDVQNILVKKLGGTR
jgi:hypothetical protein